MDFIGESCNSAYSDGDHEPPNRKLKRFNVWNYFVKIEADGKEMCECKTCGKQFISGRTGIYISSKPTYYQMSFDYEIS